MKSIGIIWKKELSRIIKDKKMAFSVFLLPVLLMVGIMYLMSNLMSGMEENIEKHKAVVVIENQAESFEMFLKEMKTDYVITEIAGEQEREKAKEQILNGEVDLLIEFPENFDEAVSSYKEGDAIPQIKTYYNPSEEYSGFAYNEISQEMLEVYRNGLLAQRVGDLSNVSVFTVNSDNEDMIIQDEDKATGKALGMMLPYFITLLLFAGAMGIGTDMIAGEKERGTMASLLVAPVKRSSIVLGKVFSLMTISGISSVIYVAAMVGCMPLMSKAMTGASVEALNIKLNPQQIVMMGVLLVALAFLYSTMIALISVFAKTIKEANSYVMPVYMLILVSGLMTMFSMGETTTKMYLIPLYNSALVFQGILAQDITMAQYGITLVETLLIGLILTGAIVKAFESEKVMAI